MNSTVSPGTKLKRPAFQFLAASMRSLREETKFHQMWRGPSRRVLCMIEGISAVTLGTHETPRAVRFYCALGFEVLRGNEQSSFTSFRAGMSYLNLVAQRVERRWACWKIE
jgi:hypothetical protein